MTVRSQFDSKQWSKDNFDDCPVGDQRRSKRLRKFARQAADRPAASLPKIGEDWGGTKGIYRLLDCPDVTLQSVTQAHRERVTRRAGRFLILSDTTHVDFGWKRKLPDAGPIGPGKGQRCLLHSGLMVDADNHSLIGLAGQVACVRPKKRRGKQSDSKRVKRWRESEMWIELFEQVGPPSKGAQYIHVCDSAADSFEVFCMARKLGCDFVIRSGRKQRLVEVAGEKTPLLQAISGLEELGRYELEIPGGKGRKKRTALLSTSAVAISMPPPRIQSRHVKDYLKSADKNLPMWVVTVQEIDPPKDVEPLHWILFTNLPVNNFNDAWTVIGWYENRFLIEEWHKSLKTGCRLESRQLQSIDRLLPLMGVLSVVAVLLVQLRFAARSRPDQPASELVPALWLKLLKAKLKLGTRELTNYEFWRAVARLGGFLGRRHDGEPGWQLIWRGWQELHTMAEGAELARKCG